MLLLLLLLLLLLYYAQIFCARVSQLKQHDLIIKNSPSQEEINDLKLLDGEGVQVDLLQSLDLAVLNQTTLCDWVKKKREVLTHKYVSDEPIRCMCCVCTRLASVSNKTNQLGHGDPGLLLLTTAAATATTTAVAAVTTVSTTSTATTASACSEGKKKGYDDDDDDDDDDDEKKERRQRSNPTTTTNNKQQTKTTNNNKQQTTNNNKQQQQQQQQQQTTKKTHPRPNPPRPRSPHLHRLVLRPPLL